MADDFDRIAANVQKMADQNAPETDIDGYLATEGMTADQFKARVEYRQPKDFGNPVLNKVAAGIDTVMNPLGAFANQATDWMALGGADEISAALATPFHMAARGTWDAPSVYSGLLTGAERRMGAEEAENPISATAGKVVGAITSPATKAGTGFINQGANIGTRALRAMVPGAITGSVAGGLTTQGGVDERLKGAAFGGATGAAIAPVAQIGGELLGRFIGMFGRKTSLPAVPQGKIDDPLRRAVTQQQPLPQVSQADMNKGVQQLLRALEADGVNIDDVARMAAAGQLDDRTLAGLAGPNTRQLIDTFTSMPGPAKTVVEGARTAAEQAQTPQIMKAAGQSLGVKQGFTDLADTIDEQKLLAKPLYDEFYAISPDRLDTPFMRNLLKNPLSKELLATAHQINRIEQAAGEVPDDVMQYLLDAQGNVSTQQTVNPRAADYIKRAIDQKVRENMDPLTGKVKGAVGIAWEKLRKAFLANIDDVAPEYAAARGAFAGPASMEDAMDIGRKILRDDWIANRKIIEEMSKSEKEALKVGAFQAIDDLLTNISNKADKAARLATIDKYLERLWPAFDTKIAFESFKRSIMSRTAEFSAVQMAGKGSQTAPRAFDALERGFDTAATAGRMAGGDKTSWMQAGKDAARLLFAPNASARAAAVSTALAPVPTALPYMSAIQQAVPNASAGALAGYPASQAWAFLQSLRNGQ